MNYKFLLSTSFIALGLTAGAQNTATYAITGDGNAGFAWMNIRQMNVASGKLVTTIFDSQHPTGRLTDADTKKSLQIVTRENYNMPAVTTELPTATFVAAAALDKQHNKLFFTPMRIGELRWVDLNASAEGPAFFTLHSTLLNPLNLSDEANHITRMDIAADGNGYAITNDANHLIRFTTGKKTIITDLGALIDDENNKSISIHNRCTSWGGDMVADAYGKLYVISANHNIFKVDINSRNTTYLGAITGLPATYTTNGAAVDDEGNIMVSSANSTEGFYKFNMKELAAVKIEGSDQYTASDLANGNLLYQKEVDAKRSLGVAEILPNAPINTDARVFPNPVTNNEFKVLFDNLGAGQYTIMLTDLSGRAVMNKAVSVAAKLQTETVHITNTLGKGVYLVKVMDAAKRMVFTERIVVQ